MQSHESLSIRDTLHIGVKRILPWGLLLSNCWRRTLIFTVADQAVFSGANLLANLLLVRWLSQDGFGAFAVSFSVFLFLSGFHNSILLESTVVLGASKVRMQLPTYLGELIWIHLLVSALLGTAATAMSAFASNTKLMQSLFTMGLATPVILFAWFLRRACYLNSSSIDAAMGSAIYAATFLITVLLLETQSALSAASAFLAMALGSALSSIFLLLRLRVAIIPPWRKENAYGIWRTMVDHLQFGKWVAVQSALTLGSGYAQTFLAVWLLGLGAAGTLRALTLVTLPISQVMTALGGYLALPLLAQHCAAGRERSFRHTVRLILAGFLFLAVLNEVGILLFHSPLSHILLKGNTISAKWLLPIVALGPVARALSSAPGLALSSARKMLYYPISAIVPFLVGLVSSVPLILTWGIAGAVVSSVLAAASTVAVAAILYRRWLGATGAITGMLQHPIRTDASNFAQY